MALCDPSFTENMKNALSYFSKLETVNSKSNKVYADDGGMIIYASTASLFFLKPEDRMKIFEEIGSDYPMEIITGKSPEETIKMCRKYFEEGGRIFEKYAIEQAKIVCSTFLDYIESLENKKNVISGSSIIVSKEKLIRELEQSSERLIRELEQSPLGTFYQRYLQRIFEIPDDLPIRRKVRGHPKEEDMKSWVELKKIGFSYAQIGNITGWNDQTIANCVREFKRREYF